MRIILANLVEFKEKIIASDRHLFCVINKLGHHSKLFDAIAVIFAEGVVYMLGTGLVIYIMSMVRTAQQVRAIVVAVVAGLLARFGFVSLIRMMDFRYRPFWYQNVIQLVSHNPNEASFPSGHAAVMGAFVTLMFMFDKKWGMVFAILALLSGFARVVVGVHFPLDIVVGFMCGIVSALIVKFVSGLI